MIYTIILDAKIRTIFIRKGAKAQQQPVAKHLGIWTF